MGEITKEDIKEAAREAMTEAIRDVLAEKIERTFGINCADIEERSETRKDMEFLRMMRKAARDGGEKIFWALAGLVGTAVVGFVWPYIAKQFK